MTIGYRVFVINADNSVSALTQKVFRSFLFGKEAALPQYASQDIHIALVHYSLKNRKPAVIVEIYNSRMTVRADGSLDQGELMAAVHGFFEAYRDEVSATAGVIDARSRFAKRRLARDHPVLPGPALKRIHEVLFR